jgi:hypothetical protein
MIPYLTILHGVGDFVIGNPIRLYLEKFSFEIYPKEGKYDCIKYVIKNPVISLFVEEGMINSISCEEECLYKGRNLIGISIEEFISHTGFTHEEEIDELIFEEDNIPQYVYEFDEVGLQVWVKMEKIVVIIVGEYFENEN